MTTLPADPSISANRAAVAKGALLGAVLGVDAVGTCIALASLVFVGGLAQGFGTGAALFLGATLVSTLALAWRGGFRNALGIAQDTPIAVIAPAAGLAAQAAAGPPGAGLATALAVLGCATLGTGLLLWGIGRARLGRMARLLPYPVAVGFLAGSGWLLTFAAFGLAGGIPGLAGEGFWSAMLPTLAFAAAVFALQPLIGGTWALLATLFCALAAHALWLPVTPPAPLPGLGVEGRAISDWIGLVTLIDWPALVVAAPAMLSVMVIGVIGFLLNTTGTELAMRADIDLDREFRVTGAANIAIGLGGGLVSYLSAGSTILAARMGVSGPATVAAYGATVLLGLALAGPITAFVPHFVTAGLLLYIGLSMLGEWLIGTRRRMARSDWLIVVIIVLITAGFGMFTAILAGTVIALALFVVTYARLPVLARSLSASAPQSNVDRSPAEERVLRAQAGQLRWAPLKGYLFFGSVERLLRDIRAFATTRSGESWLVLDFAQVSGLDASACAAFGKLAYLARPWRLHLLACDVPPEVVAALDRWHPGFFDHAGIRVLATRDLALELAETEILAAHGCPPAQADGLARLLEAYAPGHPRQRDLAALLSPRELAPGEVLIRQGDLAQDVFIVDAGRIAVLIEVPFGPPRRIRSMTAGAAVGEIALYFGGPRRATIVAEEPTVVCRLAPEAIAAAETDDPELALLLHRILASALAEKLIKTNRLVAGAGQD